MSTPTAPTRSGIFGFSRRSQTFSASVHQSVRCSGHHSEWMSITGSSSGDA